MLPSETRLTRYPSPLKCSATSNPCVHDPMYRVLTSTRVPGASASDGALLISIIVLTMPLASSDPPPDGSLGAWSPERPPS